MEPPPARIPARSRRQAMDWSLVLVSQGIETTIDYSENGDGWGLLVAFPDYEKALRTIELYRLENRGWPWRQQQPHAHLLHPGDQRAAAGCGLRRCADQRKRAADGLLYQPQ